MMKAVWMPLWVSTLAAATLSAGLGVTDARAAGVTRAQVLADLADYQSVGFELNDVNYPQNAIDATRKVVALRAERAATAVADAAKIAQGGEGARGARD